MGAGEPPADVERVLHGSCGRTCRLRNRHPPYIAFPEDAPARRRIGRHTLYDLARQAGLDYGARFRTVDRIEIDGPNSAVAHLDPAPAAEDNGPYLVHPALLDGALQALFGLLTEDREHIRGRSFLPWRFDRVRFLAPFGRVPRRARVRLTRTGTRSVSADVALYDEHGGLVAELADCWFRRIELTRGNDIDERGLRVDLVPAPLTYASPTSALECFGSTISRIARAGKPAPDQREQGLLIDALVASIAFRSMLRVVQPGRPFTIAELVETGSIVPEAGQIAEWALRLLERFGVAAETGSEWRIDEASELPDVEDVWRLLLADAPDLIAELALTAAAVESLPRMLAGGPRVPEAALAPMTEHLLHASPASAASLEVLHGALREISAQWPQGRPLRILELAATGGGPTRRVLDDLAQSGAAIRYLATNADAGQTARLSFLAKSFTGFAACQWSLADGVEALGQTCYDVILTVNACARLKLDTAELNSLREMLAPGGIFIPRWSPSRTHCGTWPMARILDGGTQGCGLVTGHLSALRKNGAGKLLGGRICLDRCSIEHWYRLAMRDFLGNGTVTPGDARLRFGLPALDFCRLRRGGVAERGAGPTLLCRLERDAL